jgi:hypothetical protein
MTEDQRRILIAGGGPVGLLCAWLIGRHGPPVRLFDNNSALQMDLRAATTHPATLDLLDDELVSDMARVGLVARSFSSGTGRAGGSSRSSITLSLRTTRGIRLLCNANSSRPQSSFWTGCSFFRMSRRCSIMK